MTFSYSQAQTRAVPEQSEPVGTSAVARWHWVQTKILHHPELTTAEICVAIVLASHVNDRTQACFPKIDTIAHEASLSDRKVRQALKRLAALGLVAKLSRAVGRLRNRNAYQLIGLGAKPASGSIKPASDAGVKPARGAGSNKKNTDKEENTDEKEQANAVSGAGATVLPAVDDQCLILAREWQRLCSEPWTLANACLRVSQAIDRVGFDAVSSELDGLRQKRKRPSRITILDALDDLMPEQLCERDGAAMPTQCDRIGPPEWQEICTIVARSNVPGCSNPGAWLSQVQANITGKTIQLVAKNRCVRDTTQNHLMDRIKAIAKYHGLRVGTVSCSI
ncbi:helix-turn-helix domain-containing protein [Thalassospira aquimaris]|uniref:Helix-turn-helix domain-containing protein n=1 Tax=Thalassospira aquimaris TaxID=3037796 RepID=A0ABT6GF85_9PROT|nr:helix-turn-helix domain-containing protein [Thalassospira sp. FZY0004]MDG4720729.1 helix-turn-helix domain-containing protein [Thalassospira sp. FZY0004]